MCIIHTAQICQNWRNPKQQKTAFAIRKRIKHMVLIQINFTNNTDRQSIPTFQGARTRRKNNRCFAVTSEGMKRIYVGRSQCTTSSNDFYFTYIYYIFKDNTCMKPVQGHWLQVLCRAAFQPAESRAKNVKQKDHTVL